MPALGIPAVDDPVGLGSPSVPAPGPSPAASDDEPGPYSIEFLCPDGLETSQTTAAKTIRARCPFLIMDEIDALGSPTIAVHPFAPEEMAIASLHGARGEGPTDRSRTGGGLSNSGPLTVFTTTDRGYNWDDKPSQDMGREGSPPPRAAERYGEHLSLAVDATGHIYGAGLFSYRLGAENPFNSQLALWKWDTPDRNIIWNNPRTTFVVDPLAEAVDIDWVSVTYLPLEDSEFFQDPVYAPPNRGNRWANNTTTPTPEPSSQAPLQHEPYEEAVVVTWLETTLDGNASLEGKNARLRAAWTDVYNNNDWRILPTDMSVGPCSSISNGVAWDGGVYVACVVEDGAAYDHRDRVATGDIDIWKIVPSGDRAELVASTPLRGGTPRLAATMDGWFMLGTLELTGRDSIRFDTAFGWFGKDWIKFVDFGPTLDTGATNIVEARIQAMVYRIDSHMIHLVYQEVYPPVGFNLTDPGPPTTRQFFKRLVALNHCQGIVALYDLQTGFANQFTPASESGTDFRLFNDLTDGLTLIPPLDGYQREFIAYGDMGLIGFAELQELNAPPCTPPLAPAAPVEPPAGPFADPVSLSSGTSTAQQVALGVAGGALALGILVRLLAARRSNFANAPAGMNKK